MIHGYVNGYIRHYSEIIYVIMIVVWQCTSDGQVMSDLYWMEFKHIESSFSLIIHLKGLKGRGNWGR